ncbi:MAG: DUF190 domain-containing protein [Candidatus Dormibacteria bacterium]
MRVRIYCDEADRTEHGPLRESVINLLWKEQAAGMIVIRGVDGFGGGRVRHNTNLIETAVFPLIIEWVDSPERIDAIWPLLEPLVRQVLVTREEVDLLVPPHHGLRRFSHQAKVADVMNRDVREGGV